MMAMSNVILVTGAAGFIGARFVESLNRKNQDLISVDKEEYFSTRKEHKNLKFGTIIDREKLFDFLNENSKAAANIKAVVHLGACTDTTEMDLAYLTKFNLEYSQLLWNYCSDNKIPLVYASSAATYGAGEHGYLDDEKHMSQLKPLNPYGDSKLQFDLWALEQEKLGKHPPQWSGFKFFNVYGFGERHKTKMASVVLQAFDQISATGSLRLFESHKEGIAHGEQKRDFIYVEDLIDVLHFALEKPLQRGIYNLGTGQARSFLDLGKASFRAMNRDENIHFTPTPEHLRKRYQYFTQADMCKLRQAGYEQKFHSLEDGVAATIAKLIEFYSVKAV